MAGIWFLLYLYSFLIGCCVGSFLNVAALRAGLAGVDDGVVLGRDGGVDGHGARGVFLDGHAGIAWSRCSAISSCGDGAAIAMPKFRCVTR